MVEWLAVNQHVTGSSPVGGVLLFFFDFLVVEWLVVYQYVTGSSLVGGVFFSSFNRDNRKYSIFTTVGERLRHLIKVSAATALKDLKSLVDLGLQEWVGPSKKTWYVLREMRT